MESSAIISDCQQYRYLLERKWDPHNLLVNLPDEFVTFIMLNPSTADHAKDDPTIRRCINFVDRWGYNHLKVVNLFAYRATKPKELKKISDPIGKENDHYIQTACSGASVIVTAWGPNGRYLNRDRIITNMLKDFPLSCLGFTKDGIPRHPLMMKKDLVLIDLYG